LLAFCLSKYCELCIVNKEFNVKIIVQCLATADEAKKYHFIYFKTKIKVLSGILYKIRFQSSSGNEMIST
jgi:hypothetical protein